MKKLNSSMKHIFIIRNPIDRAWSAMRFRNRIGYTKISLDASDEVISMIKSRGFVLRGDYERTISVYMDHFKSNQILICFYDAIQNDPVRLISNITQFLNIDDFEPQDIQYQRRINASPQAPMPEDVRSFLLETYAPMIDRLADGLGSYASIWKDGVGSEVGVAGQMRNHNLLPTLHP